MKKFILFISIIVLLFSCVNVSAENFGIECDAEVTARNICISGRVMNVTESVPVTLRVGDFDELFYIGQQMSASDGTFSFDFAMPDIASSGSYNYFVATNIEADPYSGVFEYITDSRIACVSKVTGQDVNIRGRITNATESNPVTLRVGSVDNIMYIGQTMSEVDGSFNFNFKMPDTAESGGYEYLVATNTELESYSGVLEYVTDSRILCTSSVSGREVHISGSILNTNGGNQVTLSVGSKVNPIYTAQTISVAGGKFSFNFNMPMETESGNYNFTITTDAEVDDYNGTLMYESTVEVIESQFFDGNIIVSVSNYVPTILGNVSCTDGKEINFNVINSSDNIVIAQDKVTSEDGIYNLNYVLPSLITGKDYAITISCVNETKTLFSVNAEINSSIISVSVSGDIQVADNIKLETNVQTTNSDLINKSATITSNKSISTTIPNLVANMSCYVTLRGYESVIVDNNPEPEPEPDPEPLPDADEVFQTIETEYPVEGGVGSLDRVMVNISSIPMLHEKVFTINYDSTYLELIDICAFTNTKELTTGMVAGTYVEILSVMDGQVKFKINKTFSDKVVTSGVINMMTFKKISSETAVVTSKVEKASNIQ